MDLPGYDAWKLATPPEYEREGEYGRCERCDALFGADEIDDGGFCAACRRDFDESAAEARRARDAASPQERAPEQYERDLRDAGRGHLVRR